MKVAMLSKIATFRGFSKMRCWEKSQALIFLLLATQDSVRLFDTRLFDTQDSDRRIGLYARKR